MDTITVSVRIEVDGDEAHALMVRDSLVAAVNERLHALNLNGSTRSRVEQEHAWFEKDAEHAFEHEAAAETA